MGRRILIVLGSIVVGLVIAAVTGWGALVLFYIVPGPELVRTALAWAFAALGLAAIAGLAVRRVRRWAFVAFVAGLVLVVVAWNSPKPSNDRDWQTGVAVLPYATINVGSAETMTATVTTTPLPGTPVVGATVTFTVLRGPDAGRTGTARSNSGASRRPARSPPGSP